MASIYIKHMQVTEKKHRVVFKCICTCVISYICSVDVKYITCSCVHVLVGTCVFAVYIKGDIK